MKNERQHEFELPASGTITLGEAALFLHKGPNTIMHMIWQNTDHGKSPEDGGFPADYVPYKDMTEKWLIDVNDIRRYLAANPRIAHRLEIKRGGLKL